MRYKDNGRYNEVYGKTLLGHHLIDGQMSGKRWETHGQAHLISHNPACPEDHVGLFPQAESEALEAALSAAHHSGPRWWQHSTQARRQSLAPLAPLLVAHRDILTQTLTRETGFSQAESQAEFAALSQRLQQFLHQTTSVQPTATPGVNLLLSASTSPLADPGTKLLSALLRGQTVIWKPGSKASATAYLFGQLLLQAGLPKGAFNLLHGGPQVGAQLLQAATEGRVQQITLSGSRAVADKLETLCRRHQIAHELALRGKNSLIVMEDAHLDLALKGALWSSFGRGGQRRSSTGNLILHHKIADRFRNEFLKAVQKLKIGDPNLSHEVFLGPLLSAETVQLFLKHRQWAPQQGAQLLYGKGRMSRDHKPQVFVGDPDAGHYVWPLIWAQVKAEMKIAQLECPGPTVNLIEVADFDEALAVAQAPKHLFSALLYSQTPKTIRYFEQEIQLPHKAVNPSLP